MITGVSTGIGYGIAKEYIRRGYRVYGSVRNENDANRLNSEFGDSLIPLIFDVTDQESIDAAFDKVNSEIGDKGLFCLLNNAGIAIGGPIQYQSMEEIIRHFEINVFGAMRVTRAFLPLLGAREDHPMPPGKIINISSVAGKFAAPFVAAYVGSKHALEGLSKSMRRELLIYGIDVIIIGPGAVKTPIWGKGFRRDMYQDTPYASILKGFFKGAMKNAEKGLSIEFIGKRVVDISQKQKPKTRYALVPQKFSNWTLPRLLPPRFIDKVIKKRLLKM